VKKALLELDVIEKSGYVQHEGCPWFVEFVSPPVAVGNEPICEFNNITTKLGIIKLLRPEDSVKDRLGSFYHWFDKQGLEQAVSICLAQNINLDEIEKWSQQEGQLEKFQLFLKSLKKNK